MILLCGQLPSPTQVVLLWNSQVDIAVILQMKELFYNCRDLINVTDQLPMQRIHCRDRWVQYSRNDRPENIHHSKHRSHWCSFDLRKPDSLCFLLILKFPHHDYLLRTRYKRPYYILVFKFTKWAAIHHTGPWCNSNSNCATASVW